MESIFFPLFFIEMLIIVNLRVDIYDNYQMVLRVIFYGNPNNILSMSVYHVLNGLGLALKLIGPNCLLLISFYILQNYGPSTKVDKL